MFEFFFVAGLGSLGIFINRLHEFKKRYDITVANLKIPTTVRKVILEQAAKIYEEGNKVSNNNDGIDTESLKQALRVFEPDYLTRLLDHALAAPGNSVGIGEASPREGLVMKFTQALNSITASMFEANDPDAQHTITIDKGIRATVGNPFITLYRYTKDIMDGAIMADNIQSFPIKLDKCKEFSQLAEAGGLTSALFLAAWYAPRQEEMPNSDVKVAGADSTEKDVIGVDGH
jgi:hypothetical protein